MNILLLSFGDYDYDGRLRELMNVFSQFGKIFSLTRGSRSSACTHRIYQGGYAGFIQEAVRYGKKLGNIDILVLDNRKSVLPGLFLAKAIHPQIIVQDCRELYIPKEVKHTAGKIGCFFERIGIQRADIIICANKFRAEFMKQYFHLKKTPSIYENLRMLSYSSSEAIEVQRKKFECYLHDHEVRLITTSGCSVSRTNDTLVRQLKNVKRPCRLFMVGENTTSDEETIHEIIRSENLNNVNILGKLTQDELKYLISQCDIGIVNYHQNDVNNRYCASGKIFEFLYEGLPVVTTTNPPLQQLCKEYGIGESDDNYAYAINTVVDHYSNYCDKVNEFAKRYTVQDNNRKLFEQLQQEIQMLCK